jgi:hypothetical protein
MKRHGKAHQCYEFALSYLRSALQDYERDAGLLDRLRSARNRAAASRDADRYGEDFCLYREAEHVRRYQKDYPRARRHYLELIEKFPETVYAEAAGLYEAVCLVETGAHAEARGVRQTRQVGPLQGRGTARARPHTARFPRRPRGGFREAQESFQVARGGAETRRVRRQVRDKGGRARGHAAA